MNHPAVTPAPWPTDPGAYRVVKIREDEGKGALSEITIVERLAHGGDGRALVTYAGDHAIDAILDSAREHGIYDPRDDRLPDAAHIILAALDDCGITPDEAQEEAEDDTPLNVLKRIVACGQLHGILHSDAEAAIARFAPGMWTEAAREGSARFARLAAITGEAQADPQADAPVTIPYATWAAVEALMTALRDLETDLKSDEPSCDDRGVWAAYSALRSAMEG
jgi:hypothetical protein